MQSSNNGSSSESTGSSSSDKSPYEWPTLNDVCSNDRKPSQKMDSGKNVKNHQKRNKGANKSTGGYDSSKENELNSESPNCPGACKRSTTKIKWQQMTIEHPRYKKRGIGRQCFDSNRANYNDKKNESNEYASGFENVRSQARGNNRFRGKRGRGYSNWRPRREESARGEIENGSPDSTFGSSSFHNSTIYYDPYLINMYATVHRGNELKEAIMHQIEYYFSSDNLINDTFMRQRMDSQGYLPLTLISTFNRVRRLTDNMETIIEAVKDSSKLEIVDNAKVRPVIDPLQWPLPETDRLGLRFDVPEFIPGQPYMNTLVEGMNNLNFNVDGNTDNFSETADSASLSSNVSGEVSVCVPYSAESIASPEHSINGFLVNSYVASGCDSHTHSLSHEQLSMLCTEQLSNGVLCYAATNEQVSNDASFYYGSSPEVLSSETDNSAMDHQTMLDEDSSKSPDTSQ